MTTHLPDPATTEPATVPDGRAPGPARKVYVANLVAQMAIVVTGALVRLTGSGLGCPDWPTCADGSITPTENQAETWHKLIEFGNRTSPASCWSWPSPPSSWPCSTRAVAAASGSSRDLRSPGSPPCR